MQTRKQQPWRISFDVISKSKSFQFKLKTSTTTATATAIINLLPDRPPPHLPLLLRLRSFSLKLTSHSHSGSALPRSFSSLRSKLARHFPRCRIFRQEPVCVRSWVVGGIGLVLLQKLGETVLVLAAATLLYLLAGLILAFDPKPKFISSLSAGGFVQECFWKAVDHAATFSSSFRIH